MNEIFPVELYASVPAEQVERFRRFREQHPHKHLIVDGAGWSYIDAGSGTETILLLPGGIRVAESWFKAIEALEGAYRVLCPTYPPLESMATYVAGVRALLDDAGAMWVHAAGNSFGGWLAQCFARSHPQRVKTLVLSSTSGPDAFPLWLVRLARMLVRVYPMPLVRLAFKRQFLRLIDPPPAEHAFWTAFVAELVAGTGREEAAAQYVMSEDFIRHYKFAPSDLVDWPGRVLIIESEHDMGIMQRARPALRALYPQAQVHELKGAGHTAGYVDPTEYLDVLRNFLRGSS